MKHNAPYATIEKGRVHVGSQVLIDRKRYVVTAVSADGLVLQPVKASLVGVVCRDKNGVCPTGYDHFVIPERLSSDGRYMVRDCLHAVVSDRFVFGGYLRVINHDDLVVANIKSSFRDRIFNAFSSFFD